jgi:hypothetical protein
MIFDTGGRNVARLSGTVVTALNTWATSAPVTVLVNGLADPASSTDAASNTEIRMRPG